MARRATMHSSRAGKRGAYSPKHNDRAFDASKSDHIDASRTQQNRTWCCIEGESFEEAEKTVYKTLYSAAVEATNERYRAQGHADRCRTVEDWRKDRLKCPEEMLLQVGSVKTGAIDGATLWQMQEELDAKILERYPAYADVCQVLDIALHMDEQSPHIHLRRAWHTKGRDGLERPGQNAALEAMGVSLPDSEHPRGRHNNRKMTFDTECRQMWYEICKSHGIELETEPLPDGHHKETDDYKRRQAAAAAEQLQSVQGAIQKARRGLERLKDDKKDAEDAISRLRATQRVLEGVAVNVPHGKTIIGDKVTISPADFDALKAQAGRAQAAEREAIAQMDRASAVERKAEKAAAEVEQGIQDGLRERAAAIKKEYEDKIQGLQRQVQELLARVDAAEGSKERYDILRAALRRAKVPDAKVQEIEAKESQIAGWTRMGISDADAEKMVARTGRGQQQSRPGRQQPIKQRGRDWDEPEL